MPRPHLGPLLAMIGLFASSSAASADWFTDETPPANAKPLSEIVKSVEDRGYKTIEEIEFDDGAWEIEVHQPDGSEIDLSVDAVTGAIKTE